MAQKLVVAIVQDQDAGRVLDALVAQRYGATRINTAGGFLKRGNATILVGVDEHQIDEVVLTIDENCESRTAADARSSSDKGVAVGGGTVFVLGVSDFIRM